MRKILLGTVFGVALISAPALAADMSYPVKAPPMVVAPVFSWTGFYLGVNAGYGGNKFKHPFSGYVDGGDVEVDAVARSFDPINPEDAEFFNGSADITASGFFGGGQIGYNYQFSNNWVIGAEADIQWSGIKGELSASIADEFDSLSASAKTEVEWFGTIRARLGYAWDNVLLYGTGGVAYGKVKSSYSISGTDFDLEGGLSDSVSDTNWGWTVGGGLEYAINQNWTFKTEYLYVDLGNSNLAYYDDGFDGFKIDSDVAFHTIKAGLNYKF